MDDPNRSFEQFFHSELGNLQESEVAEEVAVQGTNENNVEYDLWWYSSYTTKGCKSMGKKVPFQ